MCTSGHMHLRQSQGSVIATKLTNLCNVLVADIADTDRVKVDKVEVSMCVTAA